MKRERVNIGLTLYNATITHAHSRHSIHVDALTFRHHDLESLKACANPALYPWNPTATMHFSLFIVAAVSTAICSASTQRAERNPAAPEVKRTAQSDPTFIDTNTNPYFKCRKTPRAPGCRRLKNPWLLPNLEGNEMNALTGPQLWDFDDGLPEVPETLPTSSDVCPVDPCKVTGPSACGLYARCVRGFCVCELGLKADDSLGVQVRGWDGLEEVTVHVQPGANCIVPCDTLACKEVAQVEGCLDSRPQGQRGGQPWTPDPQVVEASGTSLGAIKAPGAEAGISGSGSGIAG
jgi:hypothetical protein